MKIKHSNRIEIFDAAAVTKIIRELLSNYRHFRKSGMSYDQWSETDQGFKYMLFGLLELQEGKVYIQIDGQSTHWVGEDNTDGFMVYANVREIVLAGYHLSIYFTDGERQNFIFSPKYQHYEKLKNTVKSKKLAL